MPVTAPVRSAALALALLSCAPLAGAGDGGPAPAPGPAPASGDAPAPAPAPAPAQKPVQPRAGFEIHRNDSDTFSVMAPLGAVVEGPIAGKADRALTLTWKDPPWMHLRLQVHVYEGQSNLDHLRQFLEKLAGGTYKDNTVEYLNEDKSRFLMTPMSEAGLYAGLLQARVQGKLGYGLWLSVNRKLLADRREDLDYILDSFRTTEAPRDSYTVPEGWHCEVADRFAIMGPVDAKADKAVQEKQRLRIAQVRSWVDSEDGLLGEYRKMFEDTRKFLARRVIHVHHDGNAFRAALGDRWVVGMKAFYLWDHPDRPVVVNGHPDVGVSREDVILECGVQYFESRTGTLAPWQRLGLHGFYAGCVERGYAPATSFRMLEKAKNDVFKRRPPKYADLQAADDRALREMGEPGAVAAWAFVQFQMRGPDDAVRRAWNEWTTAAIAAGEAIQTWKATHPKEDHRKVDSGVAKWLREEKLPDR